ncbi:MAG: hypothetical protein ACI8ZB_004801 [Desulforhopalus sp.]|jgi:hypothetical protein
MAKKAEDKKVDAFSLFPDLFNHATKKRGQLDKSYGHEQLKPPASSSFTLVRPPLPPDISWLGSGKVNSSTNELIHIPSALILMPGDKLRNATVSVIEAYGYLTETVDTALEAIHRLSFSNYEIVVVHTGFEDWVLFSDSVVHNYLCTLPMSRRRGVYYIVIGPNLLTYYRLSALALSVNLVVNDRDVENLRKLLKKGFREYEELFGPMMELLHDMS